MQQQFTTEEFVKLLPKGLITIPKKFRDEIGLKENTVVKVKRQGQTLTIEPIRTISYPVRTYTKEEIKEFIKLDKKESHKLRKKGLLQ